MGCEVIDIYVGPDRKRYKVHKQLLISNSDYFRKALSDKPTGPADNHIHLEDADSAAVALMVNWVYRGTIPGGMAKLSPTSTSTNQVSGTSHTLHQLGLSLTTKLPAYSPTIYTDPVNNEIAYYQHICAAPVYSVYSPEELRLAVYGENPQPLVSYLGV